MRFLKKKEKKKSVPQIVLCIVSLEIFWDWCTKHMHFITTLLLFVQHPQKLLVILACMYYVTYLLSIITFSAIWICDSYCDSANFSATFSGDTYFEQLCFYLVAIFDRAGRYVITGSDDRLVKIWSMETAFCLASCRGHEVS